MENRESERKHFHFSVFLELVLAVSTHRTEVSAGI